MNPLTRTVSDFAAHRLFRAAEVVAIDDVAEDFRHVQFGGDALRGVSWTPGSKVQLRIEGFTNRTFTPLSWDAENGVTSILAFVHGDGPGSVLVAALEAGAACQFLGPRGSLDLTSVAGVPLFVGDETSVGLSSAWVGAIGRPARHVFEAQDVAATSRAVDAMGVTDAEVVAAIDAPGVNGPGIEEHVAEIVAGASDAHLVLTGRAQSVRRVRAALKERGTHRGQVMVKAYWDENRSGLD